MMFAKTPNPPYYSVIFTSVKSENTEGYDEMAKRMMELVSGVDGFLGVESARSEVGITVSYWRDLESIRVWKENLQHQEARKMGREQWYKQYKVRIAKVERDYEL